jgi:bifunctional DNA-binding transcriptional regulator/antitoxin component of YhaV-PrlF toxin-antitoxin module
MGMFTDLQAGADPVEKNGKYDCAILSHTIGGSYTMSHVVGTKGQVVISKDIRQRLGIGPGWRTLQRLVDDHLEVYFVPPEHTRSLKGSLRLHLRGSVAAGAEWDRARETAWTEAAIDKDSGRESIS